MKKSIQCLLWVLLAIVLLGIAGRLDYNETVIYNMPDKVYEVMKSQLGNPSDGELVDQYVKNRAHWDTVSFNAEYYNN